MCFSKVELSIVFLECFFMDETLQKMQTVSAMVKHIHQVHVYVEQQLRSSTDEWKNAFYVNGTLHLTKNLLSVDTVCAI